MKRPPGYYYDPLFHTGLRRKYLNLTSYCHCLVEDERFNYFIIGVIVIAGITVGIQSYEQMDDVYILNVIDNSILCVFGFEVVVKVLSEGLAPYMYFTGPEWKWNNFDFAIVFLSLPFWDGLFGGGSLALLRLIRLMRLAKLIKKVPALQMIVQGLTGGLASIGYILLLLLLVFYLFAVCGWILFSKNDPFHFATVPIALMTLFRCSTLDAWSDIMYLNSFGCDGYAYIYGNESASSFELLKCSSPKKQFVLSSMYFILFVIVCGLVMLSLVIGAVTVSMTDSLNYLNERIADRRRKERYDRSVKDMFLASTRLELRSRGGKQQAVKPGSAPEYILTAIVRSRNDATQFDDRNQQENIWEVHEDYRNGKMVLSKDEDSSSESDPEIQLPAYNEVKKDYTVSTRRAKFGVFSKTAIHPSAQADVSLRATAQTAVDTDPLDTDMSEEYIRQIRDVVYAEPEPITGMQSLPGPINSSNSEVEPSKAQIDEMVIPNEPSNAEYVPSAACADECSISKEPCIAECEPVNSQTESTKRRNLPSDFEISSSASQVQSATGQVDSQKSSQVLDIYDLKLPVLQSSLSKDIVAERNDALAAIGSFDSSYNTKSMKGSRRSYGNPTLSSKSKRNPNFTSRKLSFLMPDALKEGLDYLEHDASQRRSRLLGYKLRVALGELPEGLHDLPKSAENFRIRMGSAVTLTQKYRIFAEYCKYMSEHSKFVAVITLFILLAGINVGIRTDRRIIGIPVVSAVSDALDSLVLSVFTFEVALKLLGEGLTPWTYFGDNWNVFDFIVVVGAYLPGAGSLLTVLRLLRLLRVLKLVKSLPQLEVIVNALLMGLGSIGYIGLILFLCFYVFAILGMLLFQENDPFHFGNLHIAMFTLFRCSTLDDWSEVMYVNIYGCDNYAGVYEDFPDMCREPKSRGLLAAAYFHVFIVLGALVLLTLFIGVVTTSMEQAREMQEKEKKLDRQVKTLQKCLQLTDIQVKYFREVFNSLDLDGGGTIEINEIALSFQCIKDLFLDCDVEKELGKADRGQGIDLVTFIVIMCDVPTFKYKRLLRRNIRRWVANKRSGRAIFGESVRSVYNRTKRSVHYLVGKEKQKFLSELQNVSNTLSMRDLEGSRQFTAEDTYRGSLSTMGSIVQNTRKRFSGYIQRKGSDEGRAQKLLNESGAEQIAVLDTSLANVVMDAQRRVLLRRRSGSWVAESEYEKEIVEQSCSVDDCSVKGSTDRHDNTQLKTKTNQESVDSQSVLENRKQPTRGNLPVRLPPLPKKDLSFRAVIRDEGFSPDYLGN